MGVSDSRDPVCDPDAIARLMYEGDLEALDRITRCYGERLLAVGRKTCGCDDGAQDAVQETLRIAAERMRQFRGDGSLEGWLVRIVQNVCRRMRRGAKNDRSAHIDVDGAHLPSGEVSPELDAAAGQIMTILARALYRLPPPDRALILLSDAEGWSAPELSRAFDMTPEAVRARLSRARSRLRQYLGPLGDLLDD